jgi:hypothetical protein
MADWWGGKIAGNWHGFDHFSLRPEPRGSLCDFNIDERQRGEMTFSAEWLIQDGVAAAALKG